MNKIGAIVFLALILTALPAMAHIEKGHMPDSVAEMEYRILLEFKPGDNTTRSLLGMALLRQNKLSEAEKEFQLILKSEPKNFDALDSLGLILLKERRFPEALQYLQTAIAIRPNDIMIHLHLGQTLRFIGQTEPARSILAKGITLLNSQGTNSVKEQQMAEFHAAMADLSKQSGTIPRK